MRTAIAGVCSGILNAESALLTGEFSEESGDHEIGNLVIKKHRSIVITQLSN
jgi:hypothetical protein